MDRKKYLLAVFVIVMVSQAEYSYGFGYTAPIDSTTRWVITKDDANAFILYDVGTIIAAHVDDVHGEYIKTTVTTTKTNEPDPILIYDRDEYFIPFFVSSSLMDPNTNENIIEIKNDNVLGTQREVIIMVIQNPPTSSLDWILTYDRETGILVKWVMSTDSGKETIVDIEYTNAWETSRSVGSDISIGTIIGIVVTSLILGFGEFYIIQFINEKRKNRKTDTMQPKY